MDFPTAVKYFAAGHVDGKARTKTSLGIVQSHAKESGLASDEIDALLKAITTRKYPVAVTLNLVKYLIPNSTVSEDACLSVICAVGMAEAHIQVQTALLKWLVLVYQQLVSPGILHQLYNIIFHFLQSVHLRTSGCHLLYLLTRREDVTPVRIRQLLALRPQSHSHELDAVNGLLSVYKLYCPTQISVNLPKSHKPWFRLTPTERQWTTLVGQIQEQNCKDEMRLKTSIENKRSHEATADFRVKGRKRRPGEASVVPPLVTITDYRSQPKAAVRSSVILEEIGSFDEFLACFRRIQLPCQMASVLDNDYLRYILALSADSMPALRFSYWLDHWVHGELISNFGQEQSVERGRQLLRRVVSLTQFLLEPIPVIEYFLEDFLKMWDGCIFQDEILQLLAFLRLRPYNELRAYLSPLYTLFVTSPTQFKVKLLNSWQQLLLSFVKLELPRFKAARQAEDEKNDSLWRSHSVFHFHSQAVDFDPLDTIARFVAFVDRTAMTGLQLERNHPVLQQATLSFFHKVQLLTSEHPLAVIPIPSPLSFYRLLFSHNAAVLSNLCQLLVDLRPQLTEAQHSQLLAVAPWQSVPVPRIFNGFLLDCADALVRGIKFSKRKQPPVATAFHLPWPSLRSLGTVNVQDVLSISHNMAFLGFCWRFLHQILKDGNADVSNLHPGMFSRELRQVYIDFLDKHHLPGIKLFVSTFIQKR